MSNVMYEITSASWWRAAGARALRTAVTVLLPFFLAGSVLEVNWLLAGSTVGLAVILSIVTSLAGLKEVTGDGVPKHIALGIRSLKTFAQTFASFIGASILITDVDWQNGFVLAVSATVVTILQSALLELPEAERNFTGNVVE